MSQPLKPISGAHRKPLLFAFALIGSISAALFLPIPLSSLPSPLWWLLAAILTINANIGFGASLVALNSYLPGLAKDSPEVVQILQETEVIAPAENGEQDNDEDSSAPLISSQTTLAALPPQARAEYERRLSAATSRISSQGIALGYVAGITLLILTLIPVTLMKGSTFSLRLSIGLSGIWWLLFSVPAMIWLPSGREKLGDGAGWVGSSSLPDDGKWHVRRQVLAAWRRLGGMLRWSEIKRLRNTFKFLAAWFLLSDGKYPFQNLRST